jgi:hypothetical protein
MAVNFAAPVRRDPMILNALVERLKRRSKDEGVQIRMEDGGFRSLARLNETSI